jgi:PST family polysaccharide transporter
VRELRLARVAVIDFLAAAAGSVTSIALAVSGADIWAIVIGPLFSVASASVLFVAASGWRPRGLSIRGGRPLIAVSVNLLAFTILNYWARSLDNLLIGLWLGEHELGLYMRAYALMLLPISQLTGVLSNSMLPALSQLQDDVASARQTYLDVAALVAFVAFPLMLGLSAVASPFMIALYGPQWAGAAPMLLLLAPAGALQAIMNPAGWIYISKGRTDLMFRWGLIGCFSMMASFVVGVRLGSGVAVAASYLLVNLVLVLPAFLYAGRLIGIEIFHFRAAFGSTIAASLLMASVVAAAEYALPARISAMTRLALLVPLGAFLYILLARVMRIPSYALAARLLTAAVARWDRTGTGAASRSAAWLQQLLVGVPHRPRGNLR